MPSKKKSTKSGPTAAQGKGKANGQAKPNGKAETKLPSSYARFKGDFSANAEIGARAPKLLAFKTFDKLRDHLAKAFAECNTKVEIAEGRGSRLPG